MARAEIRVAVLAETGLVGDALSACLAARPEFFSLGLIPPAQGDLALLLAAGRPDVVVIDADAVTDDLARLIKDVLRAALQAHVLVIGDQPDVSIAVAAVQAGAVAWCDRTKSVDHLVDVILGVHLGEAWFPSPLLGAILRMLTKQSDDTEDEEPQDSGLPLSTREREVFHRLARGATTDEIAREFGISVNTVRSYARRVMSKLGARGISILAPAGGMLRTAAAGGVSHTDDVATAGHREDPDTRGTS